MIEFYEKEKHEKSLKEWCNKRNIEYIPIFTPKIGVVVDGLAMGFVMQTDTALCYLETLVSNPDAEKQKTDLALDAVVEELCIVAKKLGFKVIGGFTKIQAIKDRAKKLKFEETDIDTLVLKGLC